MEIIIFSKKDGSNHIIVDGEIKAKLCRCGRSQSRPLCDGAHKQCGWEAEEQETRIIVQDIPDSKPDAEPQ
jgi:CDGSH-type Zn-finger protein